MRKKEKLMVAVAALCFCGILGPSLATAESQTPATFAAKNTEAASELPASLKSVTSIARVFGDGEKVAAVALEYPEPVAADTLSPADFTVAGQEVTAAYTNDQPKERADGVSVPGRYVILSLKYTNEQEAKLAAQNKAEDKTPQDAGVSPRVGDAPHFSGRTLPDLSVRVTQTGLVHGVSGRLYAPFIETAQETRTTEDDLAGFAAHSYTDPATGDTMPYNLYLPVGYDKTQHYPLLVFLPDTSANGDDPKLALVQGNGATVWASPAEQAKHPCIILAPEYTNDLIRRLGMMTTDDNVWTPGLTLVTHLIEHVIATYAVDTSRIYGTGQSQGGMANIAISDRYPGLFAAQYLVACQWNTAEMAALKDKKLWIVVSEGDTKAYPGMNAATALWESLGTKVARSAFWNPRATPAEFAQLVAADEAQDAPIKYTVLAGGNHMYTWTVAYGIEGIRDWLFAQRQDDTPAR